MNYLIDDSKYPEQVMRISNSISLNRKRAQAPFPYIAFPISVDQDDPTYSQFFHVDNREHPAGVCHTF